MKKHMVFYLLVFAANLVSAQAEKWTVDPGGHGNFTTVQEALNALPAKSKKTITIFIQNGTYKEKLHLDSNRTHVKLVGEDKFHTILTYDDHTGKVSPPLEIQLIPGPHPVSSCWPMIFLRKTSLFKMMPASAQDRRLVLKFRSTGHSSATAGY